MEKYSKGEVLGEGTFGVVFKATHKQTGQVVAIKKIRLGKASEGVNMTALREIKLLKELDSPHIVRLMDVFQNKQNLSLVFEYMETDLEVVIKDTSLQLGPADVKSYMQMLLQGLQACHQAWVLHRDVKPNNFLIGSSGELKLGDFGLARIFGSPDRKWTNQVFANWYRAPELFFGSTTYGPPVDVWAAGCCFAELLMRRPWFLGSSDMDVLSKVFKDLGTPTEAQWPDMHNLPTFVEFSPAPVPPLSSVIQGASPDALDLLSRMMQFDPKRRISTVDALRHRYFNSDPLPTPPALLPKPKPRSVADGIQQLPVQGSSAVQQAPQHHEEPVHPVPGVVQELGLAGDKSDNAATVNGQHQQSTKAGASQQSSAGDVVAIHRPQLDDEAARYLRKRKLNMDAALLEAA